MQKIRGRRIRSGSRKAIASTTGQKHKENGDNAVTNAIVVAAAAAAAAVAAVAVAAVAAAAAVAVAGCCYCYSSNTRNSM